MTFCQLIYQYEMAQAYIIHIYYKYHEVQLENSTYSCDESNFGIFSKFRNLGVGVILHHVTCIYENITISGKHLTLEYQT